MDKFIALDFECDSLSTVRGEGKIHCYSLVNDEMDICYEWNDKGIDFLASVLADGFIPVCHSAQYDIATLRESTGWDVPDYRCTQILYHAINPMASSYSLDTLSGGEKINYMEAMVKADLWKGTKKNKSTLYQVPFNPVMEHYNRVDARLTWKLWKDAQSHLLSDPRLAKGYTEIQMPFVDVVISMHKGMHVNAKAMMTLLGQVTDGVNVAYEEFNRDYPMIPKLKWNKDSKEWDPTGEVAPPNLASPNDVTSLLYMHGWNPTEYNRESGRPLTDKSIMSRLVADQATLPPLAKVAKRILEVRSVTGVQTQCVTVLELLIENKVPYLHPSWHATGTKTGRLSSSGPNCQNFSVRHKQWGKPMRACFTPPPGHVMLIGDLSQVELAVLAYYLELFMDDHDMADAVRVGKDIHDANTENWLGTKKGEEKFKADRSICKNGIFASSYGAQAKRLSLTIGVTISEAREILSTLEASIPIEKLKDFFWSVVASNRDVEPVKHGYAKYTSGFFYDAMGVRHFYPEINSRDRYKMTSAQRQSFNCLCQGSVASMFMSLCTKLMPYINSVGGWFSALVHDEAIIIVPEAYADEALAKCSEAFNSIVLPTKEGGVPIRSTFSICKDWSEKL
jgi:DNA polymerase I-like protein with 3'-5' exonuclease and polymerase domains